MQQVNAKEFKTRPDWMGKLIQWELCKKIKISSFEQVVYEQSRIRPGEWDAQSSQGFGDTNRSPKLGQTTRLCVS